MEKEPWQEDIYENQEEETRTERRHRNQYDSGILANHIFNKIPLKRKDITPYELWKGKSLLIIIKDYGSV